MVAEEGLDHPHTRIMIPDRITEIRVFLPFCAIHVPTDANLQRLLRQEGKGVRRLVWPRREVRCIPRLRDHTDAERQLYNPKYDHTNAVAWALELPAVFL